MRNLLDAFGSAGSLPAGITRETVSLRNILCERLVPLNADQSRALLFFPSGGYCSGSPVSHASLVARLAFVANCVGYLVDYRLAPEHPFPAAIDDAYSAYQGLLETGISQDRIAIVGDSAGGALAVATTQLAINNELGAPACLYVISPWLDLTLSGRSYEARATVDPMNQRSLLAVLAQAYLQEHDPHDPLTSPLFGSFESFPASLIDVGADEVILSDSLSLAERIGMTGGGVRLNVRTDVIHDFLCFHNSLSIASEARAWIKAHTS
jgi:monoterpene epsilon-lactone hydrolase